MSTDNTITAQNNLRNSKVDLLSTKNNDMKQRRVVNAAPAQDTNDYVIKAQMDQSSNNLQTQLNDLTNKVNNLSNIIQPSGQQQVDLHSVVSTSSITLTSSPQDIPGATITLNQTGSYLIIASIFFQQNGAGDAGAILIGAININGLNQTPYTACILPGGTGIAPTGGGTFSQTLAYNVTSASIPVTIKLQAYKQGGTGTSIGGYPATSLSIVRVI